MSDSEQKIIKATEVDLKIVFSDILKGYTIMKRKKQQQTFYIKHLSLFDNIVTDTLYRDSLKEAKEKKLPTEKEKAEYLAKEDLWTKKQDMELAGLVKYVENLRTTKSKMYLSSQIKEIKGQIEENEEKIFELTREKDHLLGYTAEKYATKRSNEVYIQQAVFKHEECEQLAISEEEFDYMTDEELNKFVMDYNESTQFITIDNIKKLSLMPFFCNYFYLCDDNPMTFYGKPVVDLSYYQSELFTFGRYFKNLIQNSDISPPDEIRNDPDKMIEFYESNKNAKAGMDKMDQKLGDKSGATSLVGATKEDLQALGIKTGNQGLNLSKIAAEKGGQLDMKDFMDLHG